MKESNFEYLKKNTRIFTIDKLSAVMSPVGSDLAALADTFGKKDDVSTSKILNLPDGIEIEFYKRSLLTLGSKTNGFSYQISNFTDHNLVIVTKFNISKEPLTTLFLPTKGELKYESPSKIKTLLVDHTNHIKYSPLEASSNPNTIKNFYQKSRQLLFELSKAI